MLRGNKTYPSVNTSSLRTASTYSITFDLQRILLGRTGNILILDDMGKVICLSIPFVSARLEFQTRSSASSPEVSRLQPLISPYVRMVPEESQEAWN